MFDDRVAASIASFKSWVGVDHDRTALEVQLCGLLTSGEITSDQAIRGLWALRTYLWNCLGAEISERHRELQEGSDVYGRLWSDSASLLCRELHFLLDRRSGQEASYLALFSDHAVAIAERFNEEVLCAVEKRFEVPSLLFGFLEDDFESFPPRLQLVASLQEICQEVEAGELGPEEGSRRFWRAVTEYYGENRAFELIRHVAEGNFGILAWPALLAAAAAFGTVVLAVPLWLFAWIMGRVDPWRTFWDDLQEWCSAGLGFASAVPLLLIAIVYIDSVLKLLQFVATLAGIAGGVIGAILGWRKLTRGA